VTSQVTLPELDCGLCGFRTCRELAERLDQQPELLRRCIHLDSGARAGSQSGTPVANLSRNVAKAAGRPEPTCASPHCGTTCSLPIASTSATATRPAGEPKWRDSLDREFDFYLEHFPEEPGPRETIIPHNPMITREMNIQTGDLLIGRPLGMSCGCPITHCGVVMDAEHRTGVINWCVTGPLKVREHGFKDLGYYIAEAYDGLIRRSRCEVRIGMRYYFQPRMCMLQWRHSGLVNYLNKTPDGWQVRVEGLWIG
jgi:uncharacterized Fe-S cluster-containing protein